MRREDGSVTEVDEDSVQRVSPLRGLAGARMGALPAALAVLGCVGPGQRVAGSRMLVGSSTVRAAMVEPRGGSGSLPADQPPQPGLRRGSGRPPQPQRVQRHAHAAAAVPCPPALHPRRAQPGGHQAQLCGHQQRGEGELRGCGVAGTSLGKRSPTPAGIVALGAVGPADGTVRLSQHGRCTGDTRGRGCSGLGMLWGHLGPEMLGARYAFWWALLPVLNFSWFPGENCCVAVAAAPERCGGAGLGREQDWAGAWQSSCSRPGQSGSCWGFPGLVPNPLPSAGLAMLGSISPSPGNLRGFCTLERNHHPERDASSGFPLQGACFGMCCPTLSLPAGIQGEAGQHVPAHLLGGTESLQEPAAAAAGPGHRAPGTQRGWEDHVLPERPGVPGGHGRQPGWHRLRYGAGWPL